MPLKHLTYFLAGINTKYFWNIPEENYFALLRVLYLFTKSFLSPFVDIASTFFDSSFNLFSTTICFALFGVIILYKLFSLSSKSVVFTKLAIWFLLPKFACVNLAVKLSDANLLNTWVVIYLSWSWSVVILFSISLVFVL